jgi:1,4-dihydroxy-2-naphthoate octaprenyltransferase
MAVAPVLAGSSLAWSQGAPANWLVFALTLLCAVLIQVGTNLLNDVADHEKGNDGADRVGPLRITAAGWATPAEVRRAAWLAFGTALALGLVLAWRGGLAILALGLVSIAAGWAYSGGRRPVSYRASGEAFVLAFFGLVAVTGSHYLQAGYWSTVAVVAGAALGAMAAAVLLLNNYRDLGPDAAAGRRTLAAVLGPVRSRRLYAALMLLPFALPAWLAFRDPSVPYVWLAWLAAPLAVNAIAGMRARSGAGLNAVLGQTAVTQFAFALLLSVGLLF